MARSPKTAKVANVVVSAESAKYEMIDVSNLILDTEHNRKFGMDEVSISAFAEEIKRDGGVHTPILVYKSTKGKFKVIAGHRRSLAAQKAGLLKIPAMVHEPLTDEQAFLIQMVENEQREEPSFIDRALSMQRAMKEFGYTQQRVAEVFKTYGSDVSKHLGLLKLDPKTQQAIHNGEFTFKDALRLKNAKPEASSLVADAVSAVSAMDKSKAEKQRINKQIVNNLANQPGSGVAKEKTPNPLKEAADADNAKAAKADSKGGRKADEIPAPETPASKEDRKEPASVSNTLNVLNFMLIQCVNFPVHPLLKGLKAIAQGDDNAPSRAELVELAKSLEVVKKDAPKK